MKRKNIPNEERKPRRMMISLISSQVTLAEMKKVHEEKKATKTIVEEVAIRKLEELEY
jgi:hypothetical protein